MNERERVLARIREARTRLRDRPAAAAAVDPAALRAVLPEVGASPSAWLELFARKASALHATFEVLPSFDAVVARTAELAREGGWTRVATHGGPVSGPLAQRLGVPVLDVDAGGDREELASCEVGLTECEALVAQTGSVVVTAQGAGGRALSVLAPHHLVVARREQLVPDLPAAFQLLASRHGERWPSMVSFVTGPSRTGDIERILVLGAHGPRQLTILAF